MPFRSALWFVAAIAITAIIGIAPFLPAANQDDMLGASGQAASVYRPIAPNRTRMGTVEFLNTPACTDPACKTNAHLLWHPRHPPGTEVMSGTFPDGRRWTLKLK